MISCVSGCSRPVSSVTTVTSSRSRHAMSISTDDSAWKLATSDVRSKVSYAHERTDSAGSPSRRTAAASSSRAELFAGVMTPPPARLHAARGSRRHRCDGTSSQSSRVDAVVCQQLRQVGTLRRCDAADDQVLLCGDAQRGAELVDEASQAGTHGRAGRVGDAAVLHVQPVEEEAVTLLVPAEVVVDGLPAQRARWLQAEVDALLDPIEEPFDASIVHEVLETCVPPVGAVPPVTLHTDDRPADRHHLRRVDVGKGHRDGGEGLRLVVRAPQATAHEHLESVDNVPVATAREKAEIAAVDVHE